MYRGVEYLYWLLWYKGNHAHIRHTLSTHYGVLYPVSFIFTDPKTQIGRVVWVKLYVPYQHRIDYVGRPNRKRGRLFVDLPAEAQIGGEYSEIKFRDILGDISN